MERQEASTQSKAENKNVQRISQLEESIRTLIPQLRTSHKKILTIEKDISRFTEDNPYESITEEFRLAPETIDPRTPEKTLGEPLEFDTPSFDEEDPISNSLMLDDVDETDMNELELIELQDRLNTQYLHAIAEFRELANKWLDDYHKLQPLRSDSPVLKEIDVSQLSRILERISN